MLYFLLGILVGMVVAMLTVKHTVKKSGAGNMRVCEQCQYKGLSTKPLVTDDPSFVGYVPGDDDDD